MKSYQYRVMKKSQGTELNVARMLQPIDFSQTRAEIDEYKPVVEEKKFDGPRKSSVSVSSRRFKEEEKPTEYTLKCNSNDKSKTWLGKSEESSKYAVLSFDGNEVRVTLTDHWYKFSPVFQTVNIEIEKEIKLGKVRRQKEEAELVKEVIGEDSEEGEPRKKTKIPRKKEEDESGREGMDFSEEFADDEEVINDDQEEPEEAALKHNLSNSGKELQKVLLQENSSSDKESDSDGIGISDSESEKEGINKQAVINELMRLGRTTLKDLISECSKKFRNEGSLKQQLSDIIREISEITGTGENAEVILKEEYKRVMPSFGVRIHFQTKK